MSTFRGRPISLAGISILAMIVGSAPARAAFDDPLEFDMPAGNLAGTLLAISRQGGVMISFAPEIVAGRRAPAIKGRLTARGALQRVLAGTGLQLLPGGNGGVTIASGSGPAPAAVPAGDLAVIDVTDAGGGANPYYDQGFQAGDAGVAVRVDGPAKEIPIFVAVTTQQVLRSQGTTTTTDTVRNIANVVIADSGDQGARGAPSFTIRGFQSGGYRVNGSEVGSLSQVPIDEVERVEVLKGPSGILTGVSAAGGVVNVALKQPTEQTIRDLVIRHGSYGYSTAAIDLGGAVEGASGLSFRFLASANGAASNYAGYKNPNEFMIAPSVKWTGEDTTILAGVRYYNQYVTPTLQTFVVNAGTPEAGILRLPRRTPLINRRLGGPVETFNAYSDQSHHVGSVFGLDIELNNSFSYSSTSSHGVVPFLGAFSFVDETGMLSSFNYNAQLFRSDKFDAINDRFNITGRYDAGFLKQTSKVGFDFLSTDISSSSQLQDLDALEIGKPINFRPRFNFDPRAPDALFDTKTKTVNYGTYFLDKIDTLDNRLHILGLVRKDWVYVRNVANSGGFQTVDQNVTDQGMTWTAGAAFDVTSWLTLYGNRSTGFRSNATFVGTAGILPPETRDQVEVGGRLFLFDKRLTINAAYFDIALTNVAVLDDAVRGTYRVVPGQTNRGYEVEAQGEILPGLNLIGSVGFVNATYTLADRGGAPASGIPKNTASLWTTYTFQDPVYAGLTFGIGAQGISSSWISDLSTSPTALYKVPGYTLVNALIGYEKDDVSVSLNINNLFDRYYYNAAYSQQSIIVGRGREAMLTMRYRF